MDKGTIAFKNTKHEKAAATEPEMAEQERIGMALKKALWQLLLVWKKKDGDTFKKAEKKNDANNQDLSDESVCFDIKVFIFRYIWFLLHFDKFQRKGLLFPLIA